VRIRGTGEEVGAGKATSSLLLGETDPRIEQSPLQRADKSFGNSIKRERGAALKQKTLTSKKPVHSTGKILVVVLLTLWGTHRQVQLTPTSL